LEDRFLVLMGDDLYKKEDLKRLLKNKFAILTYETENARQFGFIEMDSDGNLLNIKERPHNENRRFVNIGAYVISKSYFKQEMVKISDSEYGLPQTLVSMKDKCDIRILKTKNWQPIGSPSDLKKAEKVINNFIN